MRVFFYVYEGEILSDDLGWQLFYLFMGGAQDREEARSLAVEVREAGSWVFDYTLTGSDDWHDAEGSASGVFEAGNRFSPASWVLSADQSIQLSWLFAQCSPGDALHWVACREIG
jgi:hypothetical protein